MHNLWPRCSYKIILEVEKPISLNSCKKHRLQIARDNNFFSRPTILKKTRIFKNWSEIFFDNRFVYKIYFQSPYIPIHGMSVYTKFLLYILSIYDSISVYI